MKQYEQFVIHEPVPPHIQELWGHTGPYNDYGRFIKKLFGRRIQKICIDGGFTCPNRDGTLGYGGCSYCNGTSFSPRYVHQQEIHPSSNQRILEQFSQGMNFFSQKYPNTGYSAYFQSYSSSYGSLETLESIYREMLIHPQVQFVIIATRPDLITQDFCSLLEQLKLRYQKPIFIELGIESIYDQTLQRVNRHHTLAQSHQALEHISKTSLPVFAHIIFGLPGEAKEQQLSYADFFRNYPVTGLKIHHLQVLKNTLLSIDSSDTHLWELEEYLDFLCEFLARLNPSIIVDRFINEAPLDQVIAPRWGESGIKNYFFVELLRKKLLNQGLYQGAKY